LAITLFGEAIGAPNGLWVDFGLVTLMNFGADWFSAKIVLARTGAKAFGSQEAPQLYQLMERLAQRANLPTPNAVATSRNPANAVMAAPPGLRIS
jgi:heat shock protein HtpX